MMAEWAVVLLAVFLACVVGLGLGVFVYAMWVALTEGDDVIARFGRKMLRRKQ